MRVVRNEIPAADVGVHVLRRKFDKSAHWWCPRHIRWHSRYAIRLSASFHTTGSGVFNPPLVYIVRVVSVTNIVASRC
jgi:hypothetical protein